MAVMKTLADAKRRAPQTPAVDRAPPIAPDAPIDLVHLAQMTLGDTSLEREVLDLFDRQVVMLLGRMGNEQPRVVAALAHTLIGSARGIGAWKVAEAAEAVERLAARDVPALTGAIERLASAVDEARAVIADLPR
jgi:HPt (histidine-containing phosphotransfer) domain-containing protein